MNSNNNNLMVVLSNKTNNMRRWVEEKSLNLDKLTIAHILKMAFAIW